MSDYKTIKEEAMQEREDEMMKNNMYAVRKQTHYGDWEEVMIEKLLKKEISCEDCTGNCMKCPVLRFLEDF